MLDDLLGYQPNIFPSNPAHRVDNPVLLQTDGTEVTHALQLDPRLLEFPGIVALFHMVLRELQSLQG